MQVLEPPMPFQYFLTMALMIFLNLMLWAYALGIEDSYFAPAIFMLVQLMSHLGSVSSALAPAIPTGTTRWTSR